MAGADRCVHGCLRGLSIMSDHAVGYRSDHDESSRRAIAQNRDQPRCGGLRVADAAGAGARVLRVRARRGRRHGPCVDGDDCRGPRRARHRDAALSISLHGKRQQAARSAGGRACRGSGGGGGSRAMLPRAAADRGRQIVRRPHDVAGAGGFAACPACAGWRSSAFRCIRPGKPSSDRAKHLADIKIPMLFLQGTRDALAELSLLEPVVKGLGSLATLHLREGGRSFLPRAGEFGPQRPRGDGRGAGCVRGVG